MELVHHQLNLFILSTSLWPSAIRGPATAADVYLWSLTESDGSAHCLSSTISASPQTENTSRLPVFERMHAAHSVRIATIIEWHLVIIHCPELVRTMTHATPLDTIFAFSSINIYRIIRVI